MLNAWSMSLGAVLILASASSSSGRSVTWTPANVGAIFYLAILGTVVAFLSYYSFSPPCGRGRSGW